ncbi:CHAP domain-containing protein [Streptomyces sp. I8-5]|uniref:CHAP domain-containing protein n=1 Tax=Streptomyces sp. I8-5 TaxID=3104277 RepID=UPI00386A6A41
MNQASRVVAIAVDEVGYREEIVNGYSTNVQKYSTAVPGLEWSQGRPWCQTFQAWIFHEAGIPELAPSTASCRAAIGWFTERGRFSSYPGVGAQVFYRTAEGMHVGIVTRYDADCVETIEGNTNDSGSREGDGVYWKRRNRNNPIILGYGYPAFTDSSICADLNASRFGYRTQEASNAE